MAVRLPRGPPSRASNTRGARIPCPPPGIFSTHFSSFPWTRDLRIHRQAHGRECGRLSAGMRDWSTEVLSLRDHGRAFAVGALVGTGCCYDRYARRRAGRCHTGQEAIELVMIGRDLGGGDQMALAVLA